MIDEFPQFLQHIVLEEFISFSAIVKLAQTCKDLHQWVLRSFKAYGLLCMTQKYKDYSSFYQPSLYYANNQERRIFNHIYSVFKFKQSINTAIITENLLNIEWLLDNSFEESKNKIEQKTINSLLINEKIDILNLLVKYGICINHNENIVHDIVYYKSLDSLDWLFNYCQSNGKQFKHYQNIYIVAHNNDKRISNWFINKLIMYPNLFKYEIDIVLVAKTNDVYALEYLLNKTEFIYNDETIIQSINEAAVSGSINALEWFFNHYEESFNYSNECLNSSNQKIKNFPKFNYTERAIIGASQDGRIEVLNWFLKHSKEYLIHYKEQYNKCPESYNEKLKYYLPFKYNENAVDIAAQNGFLKVIKWFLKYATKYLMDVNQFKFTVLAIDYASAYGYLNILDWFFDHFSQSRFLYENAVNWAASHGNINVLDWFLNHYLQGRLSDFKFTHKAMNDASMYAHFDVLDWFYYHHLQGHIKELKYDIGKIVYGESGKMRDKIFRWWYRNGLVKNISETDLDKIIQNRDLDVLDLIFKFSIDLQYSNELIDKAAADGNITILDWFYCYSMKMVNNSVNKITTKFKYSEAAIDRASKLGHINSLYWFEKKNLKLKFTEHAFNMAAIQYHINILNWFLHVHVKYGLKLLYNQEFIFNNFNESPNKLKKLKKWFEDNYHKLK